RAKAIRRGEPNRLVTTGIEAPGTFSNRRAGPSARSTRWVTSVISRSRETGRVTRTRSPRDSRAVRNSPSERNVTVALETSVILSEGARSRFISEPRVGPADADRHPRGSHGGPRAPRAHPRGFVREVRGGRAPRDAASRAGLAPP